MLKVFCLLKILTTIVDTRIYGCRYSFYKKTSSFLSSLFIPHSFSLFFFFTLELSGFLLSSLIFYNMQQNAPLYDSLKLMSSQFFFLLFFVFCYFSFQSFEETVCRKKFFVAIHPTQTQSTEMDGYKILIKIFNMSFNSR